MADDPENPTSEQAACPHCGNPLAATAVLCTQCGYNLQTGAAIGTEIITPPPPLPRRSAPLPASASARRPSSGSDGNKWGLAGTVGTVILVIIIVALKSLHLGASARTIGESSISLVRGQYYSQEIRGSRDTKLRGTFTCSTGAPYAVYVLSSSDVISLRVGRDPGTLSSKFSTSGIGTLTIPTLELQAGSWSVVIVNSGDSAISVRYKIEEVR
jgi:hypothetical protein